MTQPYALLAPIRSPAYSAKLYRWLRAYGKADVASSDIPERVYRTRSGTALASCCGDGAFMLGSSVVAEPSGVIDFVGASLNSILTNGAECHPMRFTGGMTDLEPIDYFWPVYLVQGRCAIDPSHTRTFGKAPRYGVVSGRVECLWCGATVEVRPTTAKSPKRRCGSFWERL